MDIVGTQWGELNVVVYVHSVLDRHMTLQTRAICRLFVAAPRLIQSVLVL